jgi:aryl-alcohol dehydrogenase-like predicted oxidoreductase
MTKSSENRLKLGKTGPEVHPLGFGCMGMSGAYGATDDEVSIKTIHAAIERGVTLFDTGDFYAMGHNEMLLGRAIEGRRDKVQISVKFGALRGPDNSWGGMDSRPAAVKNFLAYSLKRLKVDVIDIYRPARLDPAVPIEETVGAIAEMIKAGFVKHIGLSEMGVETIRRAHKTHPIVDLQIEYSLASRGPEAKIFPVLHELGISATLYGVLSRGLLSGSKALGPGDFRAHSPRFNGEHKQHNDALVDKLAAFAKARGMTSAQLSIAWVRAKEPALLPVIGIKRVDQLESALDALDHTLSKDDVAALDAMFPPDAFSGGRYAPQMMHTLDSER